MTGTGVLAVQSSWCIVWDFEGPFAFETSGLIRLQLESMFLWCRLTQALQGFNQLIHEVLGFCVFLTWHDFLLDHHRQSLIEALHVCNERIDKCGQITHFLVE